MDAHYPIYALRNHFEGPDDMMDLGFLNRKDTCVIDSVRVFGSAENDNLTMALHRNPFFLGTCALKPRGYVFKKLLYTTFENPRMDKLFFKLISLKDTLEGTIDDEDFIQFLRNHGSAKEQILSEYFLQNGFAPVLLKTNPETGISILHEIAGSTDNEFANGRMNLLIFFKDPAVVQSINLADHSGLTPLHYAASNCANSQIYELLLTAGAKDLPAKNGIKPSDIYKRICMRN